MAGNATKLVSYFPAKTHTDISQKLYTGKDTPNSPNKAKMTTAQTATPETENEFLRFG